MSFELKCLDCGNKVSLAKGDVNISDFNELGVYPVQDIVIIECNCGNESVLDYK